MTPSQCINRLSRPLTNLSHSLKASTAQLVHCLTSSGPDRWDNNCLALQQLEKYDKYVKKGFFFLLLLKSHILCCNQVSYSWFCLDGSSVTPKTPFLGGFYLQCILDLISQRPAPRLARFELKKIFFFDQALFRNQSIYLTYRMSQKSCLQNAAGAQIS